MLIELLIELQRPEEQRTMVVKLSFFLNGHLGCNVYKTYGHAHSLETLSIKG